MNLKKTIAGCCVLFLLYSMPLHTAALDSTCIGYGQGKATDSQNCPLDALAFNERYAEYGAFATTPDTSRIILTFDQGYENGYTAQILDTLKEKHATAIFFLTGDYAKKETALVERMIAEGHVPSQIDVSCNQGAYRTVRRRKRWRKSNPCMIMSYKRMTMKCSISVARAENIPSRRCSGCRMPDTKRYSGAVLM